MCKTTKEIIFGHLNIKIILQNGIFLFHELSKEGRICKNERFLSLYREKCHHNFSGDILDGENALDAGDKYIDYGDSGSPI